MQPINSKNFKHQQKPPSPPPELSYEHLLFTRVQAKSCQTCSATSTLTQRLPGKDVWISCKDALSQLLKQKSANTAQHPTVKDNPSLFDSFSNPGSLTSCTRNTVKKGSCAHWSSLNLIPERQWSNDWWGVYKGRREQRGWSFFNSEKIRALLFSHSP